MFKDISIEEAKKMIEENNIFVLDVRTPAEFNASHIGGAKLIPISNAFGSKMNSEMLLESRINEIPKNKKILVYCRTGHRSAIAGKLLINKGYSEVYNVKGGITAWINAGYPIVNQ